MILQSAFFRKKKTKIYIKIFTIVITILLLLNCIYNYVDNELDRKNSESTTLVMFAKENHEDIIKKSRKVKSYQRALSFSTGPDNEIIYSPQLKIDNGAISYESVDETKINWNKLNYEDTILTFSSKSCNSNLNSNEVILFLSKDSFNTDYYETYLNKEISFNFNNKEIPLVIKDIKEPLTFNYICISDNLYDKLLKEDNNYIYDIKATDYRAQKYLKDKWSNLENNDYYSIIISEYNENIELSSNKEALTKMVKMIKIANIVSISIFFFIIIFVIKDLISDEENDMLVLKQVGYNNFQNALNLFKNIILFDLIIFILSLILYFIITIIIYYIFHISILCLDYIYFLTILFFVTLIELLFVIVSIKSISQKE